jgi:ferredoxin
MEELPASRTIQGQEELHEAVEEGIQLHPSWGPQKILGEGRVTGVEFAAVTQVFDENGRFNPQFDETQTTVIEADSVILAIGQRSDLSFLGEEDGVEVSPAGILKIEPDTLATTAPGVYAGGDAAFGPRIAIEAVANGKLAAQSIHTYLSGAKLSSTLRVTVEGIPSDQYRMPSEYEKRKRESAPTVEIDRRTGITEVEHVMEPGEAVLQAQRCLSCHIDTIYDPSRCVLCNRCADVCPEKCLVFVPLEDVEMPREQLETALENYGHDRERPMTVLLKDDTDCIRCGLCALRCPTEAITMERFNFVESAQWDQVSSEG